MKTELAERLLTQIMGWDVRQKARERRLLEALAAYKYDEYQQFAPGRRFLESLALWLRQFETLKQRQIAYEFVKSRLIFISDAEMKHLVELAYPNFIRPHLMLETAKETGLPIWKALCECIQYRRRLRRTLVLGLSDGARTDWFRRANPTAISNEQIWHAYDISQSVYSTGAACAERSCSAYRTAHAQIGSDVPTLRPSATSRYGTRLRYISGESRGSEG